LAERIGLIELSDQIKPDSPLWSNAQIQKAFALNSMERVDEAKALLENLAAKDPKDVRPLDALGNILRAHERYGEARDYYTRALALIPDDSTLTGAHPPQSVARVRLLQSPVT